MLIGYARVSTAEQNLDLQLDALKKAGCEKIFTDTTSGVKSDRPGLAKAIEMLRQEDSLLVWRLDRLGRSLKDLIHWISLLDAEGVGFKSIQESIDTNSSGGKLVFHIFGALAEFERNLIRDRTRAGLAAARARGRMGGRKQALSLEKQKLAVELYQEKKMTIRQICEMFGITKPTLYNYVRSN